MQVNQCYHQYPATLSDKSLSSSVLGLWLSAQPQIALLPERRFFLDQLRGFPSACLSMAFAHALFRAGFNNNQALVTILVKSGSLSVLIYLIISMSYDRNILALSQFNIIYIVAKSNTSISLCFQSFYLNKSEGNHCD